MVLAFLVAMRRYSLFTAQFVLNVYFFVFVISSFSLFPTYSLLKQQQQQQQLYKEERVETTCGKIGNKTGFVGTLPNYGVFQW